MSNGYKWDYYEQLGIKACLCYNLLMIKPTFSFVVVSLLIGFILGLLAGYSFFAPKAAIKETVTSRTVLDKVSAKGFLVTRTVLVDQKATIKVDQGSDWSNFFWGQETNARGQMKIDVGVDLSKLKESDILINNDLKTICIKYPQSEINNVGIEGDIEMTTKAGILKTLLSQDKTQDFNNALSKLKEESTKGVLAKEDLLKQAQDAADSTLTFLYAGTGYKTDTSCR